MAVSCVGFAPYAPHKNLIGKPNVLIPSGHLFEDVSETHLALYETLAPLVATKHDWKFIVHTCRHGKVATGFNIFHKSEKLGTVNITGKGGNYKLFITNERIDESRARGHGAWTTDPKRATLIIRKNFYPANFVVKATKAADAAGEVMHVLVSTANARVHRGKDGMFPYMQKFALDNHEAFALTLPDASVRGTLHAYMEDSATLSGLMQFRRRLNQSTTTDRVMLVIVDQDNYIVRLGDQVSLCTAETLPPNALSKLGMLKLTEPKSFFPDIGCRVSEDTFLITCEDT